MNRLCIYPKDIQRITGKSERQSRQIISNIKKSQNKEKHQPVTLQEFCNHMGFSQEFIQPFLK